jgi:hypothetical protein
MDEDNVVDVTLEILKELRGEMRAQSERMERGFKEAREDLRDGLGELRGEVRSGFAALRHDVQTLENETIRGFTAVRAELDRTNARLDNFMELTRVRFERLERRPH